MTKTIAQGDFITEVIENDGAVAAQNCEISGDFYVDSFSANRVFRKT